MDRYDPDDEWDSPEDYVWRAAGTAQDALGQLNISLNPDEANLAAALDERTAERLLSMFQDTIGSCTGIIATLGARVEDKRHAGHLSRVSERIWEAAKGLPGSLITGGYDYRLPADPEASLRLRVTEIAWESGMKAAMDDYWAIPEGTAVSGGDRGAYLRWLLAADGTDALLRWIPVPGGRQDPLAPAVLGAYRSAYAEEAGLPHPGTARPGRRYRPGQEIVTSYGMNGTVRAAAGPGGHPRIDCGRAGPKTIPRAAVPGPVIHEFATAGAARAAARELDDGPGDCPVADGDVLAAVGGGQAWIACGSLLLPASGIPDSSRYAASARMAAGIGIAPGPPPAGPGRPAAPARPRRPPPGARR